MSQTSHQRPDTASEHPTLDHQEVTDYEWKCDDASVFPQGSECAYTDCPTKAKPLIPGTDWEANLVISTNASPSVPAYIHDSCVEAVANRLEYLQSLAAEERSALDATLNSLPEAHREGARRMIYEKVRQLEAERSQGSVPQNTEHQETERQKDDDKAGE